MSIKTLKAVSYLGCFDTGATKPIKASCVNDIGEIESEYAVKLRAKVNDAETSLFSEFIASRMADKIGIQTPPIAFVNLSSDFANSVEDEIIKEDLLNNLGLNFGSKIITGYFTWAKNQFIPKNLVQNAVEVFVFDALIQNPDRNIDKPNILVKSNELVIIDHEKGFSFIKALFNKYHPWEVANLLFLKQHLFYIQLRKLKPFDNINFEQIKSNLEKLNENELNIILSEVPVEWRNENLNKIKEHITEIINNLDKFIYQIKLLLS